MNIEEMTCGMQLIDRSLIGDMQVRVCSFDCYSADVWVYHLSRMATVPLERLHRTPTHPWGPKPFEPVVRDPESWQAVADAGRRAK